jgi:DNA-binding HxlR family transcriptional regulator
VRSYHQFCALAKSLDVIGDRWSLLIVRELMLSGACRYTDLIRGLPGIATNLLADRLRELEAAGVVSREAAPPPFATTLFRLTPRGEDLRPVVQALGRWGAPLLARAAADDELQSHWLALPFNERLVDRHPDRPPFTIELRSGDEPLVVEKTEEGVRARRGAASSPDLVLEGPPRLLFRVLMGQQDVAEALTAGLGFEGDLGLVDRVRAAAPTAAR